MTRYFLSFRKFLVKKEEDEFEDYYIYGRVAPFVYTRIICLDSFSFEQLEDFLHN